MIFPEILKFGQEKNYEIFVAEHQNHYPDITFRNLEKGELIAVDIKSSYRKTENTINGMTLGAFTGYFRNRDSTKNIKFKYCDYSAHYVLGVIYTRNDSSDEAFNGEMKTYQIKDLVRIPSVVCDFKFFLQEKWRIASDKPGSGNTKNIGSIKDIERLVEGKGVFSKLGKEIFDDYWMNYLTNDMAKSIDSEVPYTNIKNYLKWRSKIKLEENAIDETMELLEDEDENDGE